MHLTDRDKNVYNTFLATSRSINNKPFILRKKFDNLDDKTYIILKKLSSFFNKYNNIKIADFFIAPYAYYGKGEYIELQYFTTPRAIKCYSLYIKQKEVDNPDSNRIIEASKEAASFIYKFCRQENLTLSEYKTCIQGNIPAILLHLKEHKINFYTIHALSCEKIIYSVDKDILDFIIENINSIMLTTRNNFQKSVRLKHTMRKAFAIIEEKLLQNKKTILN